MDLSSFDETDKEVVRAPRGVTTDDELQLLRARVSECEQKLQLAGQLGNDLLERYDQATADLDSAAKEHASEIEVRFKGPVKVRLCLLDLYGKVRLHSVFFKTYLCAVFVSQSLVVSLLVFIRTRVCCFLSV